MAMRKKKLVVAHVPAMKSEMKLRLDEVTLERHSRLFVKGDYPLIVDMLPEESKCKILAVTRAFETGIAKESLAIACTKYYAEKETKQEAQKALTVQ